jgi:hypothetical protein
MNDHKHQNPIPLGAGKLKFKQGEIKFKSVHIFLEHKGVENEQRVCISFDRHINLQRVIGTGEPFIELNLDNSFYPPNKNIPLKRLNLFLLSGRQDDVDKIDFQVSPRIPDFDELLRNKK